VVAVGGGHVYEFDADASGLAVGVGGGAHDGGAAHLLVNTGDAKAQFEPCTQRQAAIGFEKGAVRRQVTAECLDRVRPDLFILVETDFWPNFFHALHQRAIPALLVNGRMSDKSWKWYRRGRLLFTPLFRSFARLAMQTESEAARMVRLGAPAERVLTLGNLKFETSQSIPDGAGAIDLAQLGLAADSRVWVAGSTHEGEEEILFAVMRELLPRYPTLCLVVAPRQVERGAALEILARTCNLSTMRRSVRRAGTARVLILDTLGELAGVYGLAEIAFVGLRGSRARQLS
jgi:3-deoxy-D-manno-octulosonic-acid transferase